MMILPFFFSFGINPEYRLLCDDKHLLWNVLHHDRNMKINIRSEHFGGRPRINAENSTFHLSTYILLSLNVHASPKSVGKTGPIKNLKFVFYFVWIKFGLFYMGVILTVNRWVCTHCIYQCPH